MAGENEKTTGYVILTGVIEPEDEGGFTAVCPELGVASCGDTVEEALDMLGEAIDVQLEDLQDLGQLDGVLRGSSVKKHRGDVASGLVSITVQPETIVRAYPRRIPVVALPWSVGPGTITAVLQPAVGGCTGTIGLLPGQGPQGKPPVLAASPSRRNDSDCGSSAGRKTGEARHLEAYSSASPDPRGAVSRCPPIVFPSRTLCYNCRVVGSI